MLSGFVLFCLLASAIFTSFESAPCPASILFWTQDLFGSVESSANCPTDRKWLYQDLPLPFLEPTSMPEVGLMFGSELTFGWSPSFCSAFFIMFDILGRGVQCFFNKLMSSRCARITPTLVCVASQPSAAEFGHDVYRDPVDFHNEHYGNVLLLVLREV